MLTRHVDVRGCGQRHRQRLQRGLLGVGESRKKSQVIAERRARRQRSQPRGAPRKHELAIGQADAGYGALRQGFDLTRFEDALRHRPNP